METKFDLHLCANYSNEKLKSAICNCVLCDYIIEELRQAIKRFNKEDLDLFYVYENFKKAIEKSEVVTFSSLSAWEENKISAYQDCLNIIVNLDDMASKAEKINAGDLIEEVSNKCQAYSVMLSLADISLNYVDFSGIEVREEYLTNLKNQLALVDEGQFLSDLGTMRIEMSGLDINKYRNKFIEQKLRRASAIVESTRNTLDKEFDRLHDEIMNSYDKFYKVAHAALSDGEKVDASRKICKLVNPHRVIMDKLENKLTEANELKRQLTIHENKLIDQKIAKTEEFSASIDERPYEKDIIDRERDALNFVTSEYIDKIDAAKNSINAIEEEIAERYKILDRVEVALKAAIPTENEMKRYTGLAFKYEDLYVRLELAKSQIKDKDKDFVLAIDTAILGLGVLINLALEGKDIFMRNSLLSAVFNCVNGIYDLVDNKNKSVELSQIKFVTTRLVKYSLLNNTLMKDLQTFRHVCNNTIRDVAMMMGKPFSLKTMLEINDTIDISIKQIEELVNTINDNHVEQTRILGDILNV
jgi:hypothetical protein